MTGRTLARLALIAATGGSAVLIAACGGTGGVSAGATGTASTAGHTTQSTTRKSNRTATTSGRGQGWTTTVGASASQLCGVLTEAMARELLGTREVVRVRWPPYNTVPSCGYEVAPAASTSDVRPNVVLRIFSKEPVRWFRVMKETYEKGAKKSPSEVELKTLSGIGSAAYVLIFRGGVTSSQVYFLLDGRFVQFVVGGAVPSLTKLEADVEAIAAAAMA